MCAFFFKLLSGITKKAALHDKTRELFISTTIIHPSSILYEKRNEGTLKLLGSCFPKRRRRLTGDSNFNAIAWFFRRPTLIYRWNIAGACIKQTKRLVFNSWEKHCEPNWPKQKNNVIVLGFIAKSMLPFGLNMLWLGRREASNSLLSVFFVGCIDDKFSSVLPGCSTKKRQ